MVLLAVLVATLAVANAGQMDMNQMMQMMQMMQQQQGGGHGHDDDHRIPMGNGGCHEDNEGRMPAGCELPMPNVVNMEEYLNQQMQTQQYETKQMADQIRAQFEKMVREVTAKKHRFVMSLVTEFVSTCTCAGSSEQIYNGLFLQQAAALNLTTEYDMWDGNRKPYEAESEEDARALVFGGLFRSMCEAAGAFMTFAENVSNRIPFFVANGKK